MNVRIQDGMTNGAGNIVKKINLYQSEKPSGIIWVQFDHADVGEKTRQNNKNLYTQCRVPGVADTWCCPPEFARSTTVMYETSSKIQIRLFKIRLDKLHTALAVKNYRNT